MGYFLWKFALWIVKLFKKLLLDDKQILYKNEGKINKYTHGIKIGNLTQE